MEEFESRECPLCGAGTIALRNVRGTVVPFKDETAIAIAEDLLIPTCDNCGEMFLNAEAADRYDQALRRSYEQLRLHQQRVEIERALAALRVNQTELESLLGVSQGYISKLLRGEKLTSATTLRFLHVLGSHPQAVRSLADIAHLDRDLLSRVG